MNQKAREPGPEPGADAHDAVCASWPADENSVAEPGQATVSEKEESLPIPMLHAGREGEWMEAEDLRAWALDHAEASEVAVDLSGIEHLDASALQVLLAIDADDRRQGRRLHVVNCSAELRQWFDFAGATDLLFGREPASAR